MLDRALFAIAHYAVLALLVVAAYVIGSACLRKARFESRLETGVFRIGVGLGAIAYMIFVMGLLHVLYAWLIWTLLLVCLVLFIPKVTRAIGARDWWQSVRAASRPKMALCDVVATAILAGLLVQALLMPLYPPVQADAISYHFAAARLYATSHSIQPTPYLRFPVAPQTPEMLFALALLIQDDVTAQLVSCLMMLLCAIALYSWGRRAFSARTGFFAAILFLACPLVLFLGSTGYIDIALALFVTLAMYALSNWGTDKQSSWVTISAVLIGLAAGSKYSALFFLPALSVYVFAVAQKGSRWRLASMFILVCLAVCVPWYVRDYLYSGNPFFPFCGNLFPTTIWNATDLRDQMSELSLYGAGKSVLALALIPVRLTISQRLFHIEGFIAPFMILTPLMLVLFVRRGYATAIAGVAFSYLLFWFANVQIIRYLIPVVPLFILLAAYMLLDWPRKNIRPPLRDPAVTLGTIVILIMTLPGCAQVWHQALGRGPYPTRMAQRNRYVAERVPGFSAIEFLNDARGSNYTVYALYGPGLAYYADGRYRGDWFGPAGYPAILKYCRSPRQMCGKLTEFGTTHLLVVSDRWESPVPKSGAIDKYLKVVHRDSQSVLYELRSADQAAHSGPVLQ